MKKILTKFTLMFAIVLTSMLLLVGCGKKGTEIAILVPDATHGWPVGVVHYAKESAKELGDRFEVQVITSKNSEEQANQIDDLLTLGSLKGIVILPFDNDVAAGVRKIKEKGIPFVMFDRIIEGVDSNANVQGDNRGIGYETAKVMVQKGLQPGDKILEMPGDNSSVPTMRSNGFREYLKDEAKWTDEQIKTIDKTGFTGWSRDTSETIFSDWLDSKTQEQLNEYKYIFTHDDEISWGILDVIGKPSTTKTFAHVEVIASSAGQLSYYQMLDTKPVNGFVDGKLPKAYLFSVTYPPRMIQDAIKALVDVLDGKTVVKDMVIPVEIVDSKNAKDFIDVNSPY